MAGGEPTFAGIVAELAERSPDRLVVVFEHGPGTAEHVLAANLETHGNRIAWLLERRGIGRGDRVAIQMRNHPEFLYGLVALSKLGALAVPVDPRATGEALRYYLKRVECSAAITADYVLADAEAASAVAAAGVTAYAVSTPEGRAGGADVSRYESVTDVLLGEERPDVGQRVEDAADPWLLQYTSGTTGNAKPIVMTYRSLHHYRLLPTAFGYQNDDVPYTGLPLAHGNARGVTVFPSLFGATHHSVVSRWFTSSRLWDVCSEHGCTTWSNLGGIATTVYAQPPAPGDRAHRVRVVISAGMPRELREPFERRFGVAVHENYGTSEGGVLAVKRPGEGPADSIGKPLGDRQLAILGARDELLPAGEIGEIVVRADDDRARLEYWGDPEATAAKLHNGWLRTGDLGRVDAEGWLYFVARREDGGIRKLGEFVPIERVQRLLADQPEVQDVCVYGIPAVTGAAGEKDVVAAVVPRAGAVFDPARLLARCDEELPRSARPDLLQVVTELPKTPTQKVQVDALERLLTDEPENVYCSASRGTATS